MATIILQACNKRQCLRHSSLLIHNIIAENIRLDDLNDRKKLKKIKDDLKISQDKVYTILCEKTGTSWEEIRDICKKEIIMSPEKAITYGLIDEIL